MIQFMDSNYTSNDILRVLQMCRERPNECLGKLLEFLHVLDQRQDVLYVLYAHPHEGDFGFSAYTPWAEGRSKGDPHKYAGRSWASWIVGGVNWSEAMEAWSSNS